MNDPVDVVALQEELRLALVAREAVDDEAVVPVVLAEPLWLLAAILRAKQPQKLLAAGAGQRMVTPIAARRA